MTSGPNDREATRVHDPEPSASAARTIVHEPSASPSSMPADDPLAPSRLGRYVVLRKLGEGGMGMVLAAYDEQLDRRVAIKVLLHGHGSESLGPLREQLRREAQALARLAHPNVVSVFEVGEDAGRMFMAMELVQGQALGPAMAAAREQHGVRGVLGLLVQAGRGLAAAHDAGLLHRDFKPANAIVDGHGRVRVLDFGLARVFDPDAPSATMESGDESIRSPGSDARVDPTMAGTVMGTPAYMSPEQHFGQPLDARSDQYSFCVTLYEGLYGRRPYQARSREELAAKALTGVPDPVEPDRRVPTWLRRAVLRGLAPDPDARWPSMHALLAALERGLDRRRPWALGAAGLAVVAAAIAYASTTASTTVCADTHERMRDTYGDAQRELLRGAIEASGRPEAATTWAGVSDTLDRYALDWSSSLGQACQAHHRGERSDELYDLQVACLEGRRDALAEVIDVLGHGDAATLDHAVPMAMRLPDVAGCADLEALTAQLPLPSSPDDRARVVELRRRLARVGALEQSERYDEGLALDEQVLADARALGYAPLVAEALSWRGSLLELHGRYAEAEAALDEGFLVALGSGHDEYAVNTARMLIYTVAIRDGRVEQAAQWGRLAAALIERSEISPRTVAAYHSSMGALYRERTDHAGAKAEHERALAIYRRIHPPDHPDTAVVLGNIAYELQLMGDLAGAQALFEEALAMDERLLGPGSAAVASEVMSLGYLALDQGDRERARRLLERSRDSHLALFGPTHPNLAYAELGLGSIAMDEGDLVAAAARFEAALALRRRLHGEGHVLVAAVEESLADVDNLAGRWAAAEDRLLGVTRAYEANHDAGHVSQLYARLQLARVQRLRGAREDATATLTRALELARRSPFPRHDLVAWIDVRLAQLAHMSGDHERAAALLDDAEAALALAEPIPADEVRPVLAIQRAELELAVTRAAAARALLAPYETSLGDLRVDDRAQLRMVFARARAQQAGRIDDEARRLATLALEELRAAHMGAQADAVAAWLAGTPG